MADQLPEHYGITFTKKTHEHAEGPTLPENNKHNGGQPYNVVVTGAGKGLGYAISLAYAKAGATGICISSRTQSDLDKLSKDLKSINSSIHILSQICDTSKADNVKSLAEAVEKEFGKHLDVVVANAGVINQYITDGSPDPISGEVFERRLPRGVVEDEDFARVTNINYLGSFYTAKYFTPLLVAKDNLSTIKSFIVITSLASMFTNTVFTPIAYSVSKLANNRMIEIMDHDHRSEGLVCYAVHPGEVLTPQTQGHSNAKDDIWEQMLQTDIGLAGGFCTWLTREKREYLSGRYVSVHWDVDELEQRKDEIVKQDKLKFRMAV